MAEKTESDQPSPQSPKVRESRPTKYLPTSRITHQRQLSLLLAYGMAHRQTGASVSHKAAGEIAQLSESTAALMNPFFTENRLISKVVDGFLPSTEVVEYAKAYEWDKTTASTKLRSIMEKSWFALAIMPRLRMAERTVDEVLATLAEACSAAAKYKPQLELLLDYLHAAGVIRREGSMVRPASGSPEVPKGADAPGAAEKPAESTPPAAGVPPPPQESRPRAGLVAGTAEGVVQFQVSINVDMAELSGWEPRRITAFFGGIAAVLAAKRGLDENESD